MERSVNNDVLAIITATGDRGLAPAALETLGAASELANKTGGTLFALVSQPSVAADVATLGPATVHTFAGDEVPSNEALLATCAALIKEHGPGIVFLNRGPEVLEIVPRLAARTNGSSVTGVVETGIVDGELQASVAVFGGAARAQYKFNSEGPVILTMAPGAATAPESGGTAGEVVTVAIPDGHVDRVKVVEPVEDSTGPRLEDARIVVSGGRGIREAERYESVRELAANLGGMAGASRAIVDDGWATPAEQVGLTGTIVTPDLYIAIGISGASQHLAGCSSARTLVAVNTDPDAPIFKYAHYGIVDDGTEVMNELIKLTKDGAYSAS